MNSIDIVTNKLPLALRQRLELFAAQERIEYIEDLAFFFRDEEEAEAQGLSEAWSRAKLLASGGESAWHAVQSAEEAEVRKCHAQSQAGDMPKSPVPVAAPRSGIPKIARPRPRTEPGPEDARRIVAAQEAVSLSLTWAPDAGLGAGLLPERAKKLGEPGSPAVARISRFEPRTVQAAVKSWKRWFGWAKSQSICPTTGGSDCRVIDDFISSACGVSGSARSMWYRLHWLQRHLRAPFSLDKDLKPAAHPRCAAVRQATALEPEMILHLGAAVVSHAAESRWTRVAAAAMHALVYAWLRFAHLQRSRPLERTDAFVWFRCARGKRGHGAERPAFDWCLPRGEAADILWRAWHKRAAVNCKRSCGAPPLGLAIDPDKGGALSLSHFNKLVRSILGQALADEEEQKLLSSYSLRRAMPTFADTIAMDWQDRLVAGGWSVDSGSSKQGFNVMPLRYSGQRRQQQAAVRLHLQMLLETACCELNPPVTWTQVRAWWTRPGTQTAAAKCRQHAAEVVAGDTTTPEEAKFLPEALKTEARRRCFRRIRPALLARKMRFSASPPESTGSRARACAGAASAGGQPAAAGAKPCSTRKRPVVQPSGQARTGRIRSRVGAASDSSDGEVEGGAAAAYWLYCRDQLAAVPMRHVPPGASVRAVGARRARITPRRTQAVLAVREGIPRACRRAQARADSVHTQRA